MLMRTGLIAAAILCVASSIVVGAAPKPALLAIGGWPTAKGNDSLEFPYSGHSRVAIRLWGIAVPDGSTSLAQLLAPLGRVADCRLSLPLIPGHYSGVCHFLAKTHTKNCRNADVLGETVRVCEDEGDDIAELLVLAGDARDCPNESGGRYAAAESKARASGHDLGATWPLPTDCGPYTSIR
jgi:endonuclease YncB( thermonuclease family)